MTRPMGAATGEDASARNVMDLEYSTATGQGENCVSLGPVFGPVPGAGHAVTDGAEVA
jgi:hypothetical protein